MGLGIVEHNTRERLEFDFVGLESWEDFDFLVCLLEKYIRVNIVEKIDSPYSKFCSFEKEGIKFELMYHPEIGNLLYLVNPNDKDNELQISAIFCSMLLNKKFNVKS